MQRIAISENATQKSATPEPSRTGQINLAGALTIRELEPVHARLREAIRQHQSVTVDCTDAATVDLCFIQLMLSARKTAEFAGKTLTLARPASGVLLDTLLQAGLVSAAGGQPVAGQAFWLKQERDNGKNR